MKRKLSPLTIISLLAVTLAVVVVAEESALQADEQAKNPPQVVDTKNCIKCHHDPAFLRKMRAKEGNGQTLFDATGNLRDAQWAEHYKKYDTNHKSDEAKK